METQMTQRAKYLEKKWNEDSATQTSLTDLITTKLGCRFFWKKQKYRSMEQGRKLRNKPMYL